MSAEASRAVARQFIESIPRGSIPDSLLAPEFSAWSALSGELTAERYKAAIAAIPAAFPEGLSMRILSTTVEDGRVSAQAESHGVLKDGQPYRNDYHFLVLLDGSRVRRVFEYFNTKTAVEVLLPALGRR